MSVLNNSLQNFQGCCLLFNYQGSLLFCLTARLVYHILNCLSRTFLTYFSLSFYKPFKQFVCESLYIIPCIFRSVKMFFHLFLIFLFIHFPVSYMAVKKLSESSFQTVLTGLTEKEGFEPSRRLPDLHPQQGRLFSLLSISPAKVIITSLNVNVNYFFHIFYIFFPRVFSLLFRYSLCNDSKYDGR